MRNYCKNTKVCRRKCLMSEFSDKDVVSPRILHRCCDLCAQVCECDECSRMDETVDATQTDVLEYQAHTPPLQLHTQRELIVKLEDYRKPLHHKFTTATLLVGEETCTGLTKKCIEKIVHKIKTNKDILDLGVVSQEYSTVILNIIESIVTANNE